MFRKWYFEKKCEALKINFFGYILIWKKIFGKSWNRFLKISKILKWDSQSFKNGTLKTQSFGKVFKIFFEKFWWWILENGILMYFEKYWKMSFRNGFTSIFFLSRNLTFWKWIFQVLNVDFWSLKMDFWSCENGIFWTYEKGFLEGWNWSLKSFEHKLRKWILKKSWYQSILDNSQLGAFFIAPYPFDMMPNPYWL